MADNKLVILIDQLIQKTFNGILKWEETANEGQFSVSFPKYSVIVSQKPSKDSSERNPNNLDDIVLTITNSEGETVEEVRDTDFRDTDFGGRLPYRVMLELYNMVRRRAMGLDDAIDSILFELNKTEINF